MPESRAVRYIEAADITAANRRATAQSGDPFALLHAGTLEHLLQAVRYKYSDKPYEEAVLLKAAYLLDLLANKGHVFLEGNKRTAISSTLIFLEGNGLVIEEADQKALVGFVLAVARGQKSLGEIHRWLKERVKTRQSESGVGDRRG
jgi:death-on-curing protein